ncbi:PepSY-associated TM helix domain-containing protein [Endothiovibrio diazotrophicus]
MIPATLKARLFTLHRWLGIGLAPLFLLIILSGAVLALKPILGARAEAPPPAAAVDPAALGALLQRIDPTGRQVSGIEVEGAGGRLRVRSPDAAVGGLYDLGDGRREAAGEPPADPFRVVESLHKGLLLHADVVTRIASYAMLLLVVAGPLLARPRLRNNLRGWHRGVGWLLLPLLLMLPLSGILMSLHIGMPELPRMSAPGVQLSLGDALQRAAVTHDLGALREARRFRGGSVMLRLATPDGPAALVVTDTAVTPLAAGGGLIKALHEGTWAGAWSGLLNLLGALALALLTVTGTLNWLRGRRRPRSVVSR